MSRTILQMLELVREWWRVDRVRASPFEGRLLRLSPGAIVCVGGKNYQVTGRAVIEAEDETIVRYHCVGVCENGRLLVRLNRRGSHSLEWIGETSILDITEHDVEVFASRNCSGGILSRNE